MATASQPYRSNFAPYPSSWPTQQNINSNSTASVPSASSSTDQVQVQLVATGKKRKRLQRACVACHKAKRRCDGGLPCSNCDFSGRTCCYSDSQGKTVAPTKRTLKPSEAALQERVKLEQQQQQQQHHHHHSTSTTNYPSMHGSPPSSSGLSYMRTSSHSQSPSLDESHSPRAKEGARLSLRVEPSLESRREMLCIFFSHLQPLNSAFDEISFLRDLSSMEVSWVLLYAMYAVSAKYAFDYHQEQVVNLPTNTPAKYSKLIGETGDGRQYAKEARRLLYREDEKTNQSLIDGAPSLEVAQALCLLSYFEFNLGRHFRASSYIQQSSKHVIALRLHVGQAPASSTTVNGGDELSEVLQRRNAKRLTCLVMTMDVTISMMNGQTMSLKSWDVEAAVEAFKQLRSEDDEESMALTQLLHTSYVLNGALELKQRSKSIGCGSDFDRHVRSCKQELQRWAEELPRIFHFNEVQLNQVGQTLNDRHRARSPTYSPQMSKSTAICWTLMHTMAETTTLVLKDLITTRPEGNDGLAACNNLIILLERSNPASLPRLLASFSIAVLYSASQSIRDQVDEGGWSRIGQTARSFASETDLSEQIWANMASWWSNEGDQQRRTSKDSSLQSLSPMTPASLRLQPPSPPSNPTIRQSISSSSLAKPLPDITNYRTTSLNYHHLPPLAKLSSTSTTLPPLRFSPTEKSSRHFGWEQSHRSLTVNQS